MSRTLRSRGCTVRVAGKPRNCCNVRSIATTSYGFIRLWEPHYGAAQIVDARFCKRRRLGADPPSRLVAIDPDAVRLQPCHPSGCGVATWRLGIEGDPPPPDPGAVRHDS